MTIACHGAEFQAVQLAWNPSPDSRVTGYNLYYGPASGVYTNKITVGAVTNASITNLIVDANYFFTATAYDDAGLESESSNEVAYSGPIIGDNEAPEISVINDLTIQADTSTGPIGFSISDPDTPLSSLILSARSSNVPLLSTNNIVFGGIDGNRSVTLTPTLGQTGSVVVTIYVYDGFASNSSAFLLTVLPVSVTNPVAFTSGRYSGLFYEGDEVQQASSGSFTISLTTKRTYSGRITLGAGRYSFSGSLGLGDALTNTVARKDGPPLRIELDFSVLADQVVGRVTDGQWEASVLGDRAVFNTKTNPAPQAGSYTLVLPGSDAPGFPAGHGYATVRINPAGIIKLKGALADGTKISHSAGLSKNGLWPLYVPLYTGKGSLTSWLTFTNQSTSDLIGELAWIKRQVPLLPYYAAGFTNQLSVVGSLYQRPLTSTAKVLPLTDGEIAFAGGQLPSDFANLITLGAGSQVANWSSNRLTLKFSASSGLFNGSVVNPVNQAVLKFKGAVLQKLDSGYGFLLLTNQSSKVVIQPRL